MWKANGKTKKLLLFPDILFPKTDIYIYIYIYIYICEMLPLETKQSGGKLHPLSGLREGGSVSRGNIQQQALKQEGFQRKGEGPAQLQDRNVECKNLESRRQIGKTEKGNAEERGVCSMCQ